MKTQPIADVKGSREVVLILDNIRSTHNVGSAFRTGDAAGITHIYLCGTTPTPLDRFNREQKDVAKVALGSEKTMPWTYTKSTTALVTGLKKKGFFVIAIEQDARSIDYKKVKLPAGKIDGLPGSATTPVAIVFGNEVDGVSKSVLDKCDVIAEIPMRGMKESLNVSVSMGVALFRILRI